MKPASSRTPAGAVLTDLILAIFRFNGALLGAGDRLTADFGLTSARWQVMGAIADAPLTVAAAGRRMGLTRQAVQRVANELAVAGVVAFADNPDHKRARLMSLTPAGRKAYGAITERQIVWSNALAKGRTVEELRNALALLRALCGKLED